MWERDFAVAIKGGSKAITWIHERKELSPAVDKRDMAQVEVTKIQSMKRILPTIGGFEGRGYEPGSVGLGKGSRQPLEVENDHWLTAMSERGTSVLPPHENEFWQQPEGAWKCILPQRLQ